MECKYCSGSCIKAGKQRSGVQKFYCKRCTRYQQSSYTSAAYHPESNNRITALIREGMALRSIARVLRISLKTIIVRILKTGDTITKPFHGERNSIYELDELWSFVGSKENETWIMYAFDRNTRSVIDFRTGSRNKANLKSLTDQVLSFEPKRICTDGLAIYQSLLPASLHRVGLPGTRHIERHNLNLRTHLKRLSRRTICFSKSLRMLNACLKVYFWSIKAPSETRSSTYQNSCTPSLG